MKTCKVINIPHMVAELKIAKKERARATRKLASRAVLTSEYCPHCGRYAMDDDFLQAAKDVAACNKIIKEVSAIIEAYHVLALHYGDEGIIHFSLIGEE